MQADTTTTKAESFTTKVPIIIWSLTIEDTIFSSSNMDIKIFVVLSLIISLVHGYLNPFYGYLDPTHSGGTETKVKEIVSDIPPHTNQNIGIF